MLSIGCLHSVLGVQSGVAGSRNGDRIVNRCPRKSTQESGLAIETPIASLKQGLGAQARA